MFPFTRILRLTAACGFVALTAATIPARAEETRHKINDRSIRARPFSVTKAHRNRLARATSLDERSLATHAKHVSRVGRI